MLGASGVLSLTRVSPAPGGQPLTETYFEQPMVMVSGSALDGHLRFFSAVSFDRLTTPDGVLTLGAWGAGYYDREHPHEYLHEAIASLVGQINGTQHSGEVSISGGKGVVPFGSDPPMDRPALHVPVNHHWSQIMERALVVVALRLGRVVIEGSLFDGNESGVTTTTLSSSDTSHQHGGVLVPQPPPRTGFGQSRTARLTWRPSAALEFRASAGTIRAPGHHPGAGAEPQPMWNLSAKFDRPGAATRTTIMAELGRASVERPYWTALAEGQLELRQQHRFYYRVERTDRPEAPRTADLFHTAIDTLGVTPIAASRWFVQTAGYGYRLQSRWIAIEPIMEVALAHVSSLGSPPVNLDALYVKRTLWSGVLALRVTLGRSHMMGQYGAMAADGSDGAHHH